MKRGSIDDFIEMQCKVRADHDLLEKNLRNEAMVCLRIIEQLIASRGRSAAFQQACTKIAGDPNTPAMVLEKLAGLGDADIQGLVAKNPNVSQETLQWFCADSGRETAWLRAVVAGNPRAPDSLLNKLRKGKESQVAAVASKTLKKKKLL